VGFLGAGVIFQRGISDVRGITTAASAWAVTAVGIVAGVGAYVASVLCTAIILLVLELDQIPLLRRIHELPEEHGESEQQD
jgi:putative Mg2+ transporter-C (MgtC) family protein